LATMEGTISNYTTGPTDAKQIFTSHLRGRRQQPDDLFSSYYLADPCGAGNR